MVIFISADLPVFKRFDPVLPYLFKINRKHLFKQAFIIPDHSYDVE